MPYPLDTCNLGLGTWAGLFHFEREVAIDCSGQFITPSKETTLFEPVFLFNKTFTTAPVEEDGGFSLPNSIFIFLLIGEVTGELLKTEDTQWNPYSIPREKGNLLEKVLR